MERQYTRLDKVRNIMDPIIKGIDDEERKRCAYVHLYGVGLCASFLALKRGCSREEAELAEIAGMLHDLEKYVDDSEDDNDGAHAHRCADYARENVLAKISDFTSEEVEMIYRGIYNHSDKDEKGHWFDEIVKDADSMQHAFRNPVEEYFFQKPRVREIMEECKSIYVAGVSHR